MLFRSSVAHAQFMLSEDATSFTPGANPFYPVGTVARSDAEAGHYELWAVGQWPAVAGQPGIVEACVQYIRQGANNGRFFNGAGLTWVKQA